MGQSILVQLDKESVAWFNTPEECAQNTVLKKEKQNTKKNTLEKREKKSSKF